MIAAGRCFLKAYFLGGWRVLLSHCRPLSFCTMEASILADVKQVEEERQEGPSLFVMRFEVTPLSGHSDPEEQEEEWLELRNENIDLYSKLIVPGNTLHLHFKILLETFSDPHLDQYEQRLAYVVTRATLIINSTLLSEDEIAND